MRYFVLLITFLVVFAKANGQTQNTGWFFLSHTQKVSEKFDIRADVQTRSADKYDYFGTLLLRGALSYNLSKVHSVALGYAYKGDWLHEDGRKTYSPENRIYQQYLYDFKAGKTELNLRGRLEQRFVKEDGKVSFSQRARIFISAQIPLIANADFSKGVYTGVQNEIFLNVQNKANVNNSVFDQNRVFGSLGYRWSKKIDTEFGYMYWYQKEMDQNTKTNVWQLMVTTSF
ncbi:DUF2490 domain-containing protein [Mucilaginibacter pallidiroseus]|uniref:DUF2490 domain-containing protein n=1 Tax=Mucilaginibacter pallidiroseus TaxID=2599295 RepID=A0A563U392_9SPHI|nr:DUF2490 domain-containing protein [Mucilaginibacter pallidiroseus]TWR25793.1 DUF2490 domain-containing protein [Mucilaginibacter pallidiroseus]